MRSEKSIIPSEYQQVEYLEAQKQQYFWSDVEIQDGLTVDAIQSFNARDTYLIGGYASANQASRTSFNGYYSGRIQGGYPSGYYLAGSGLSGNNEAVYHVVTTHKDGNRTIYVDDSLINQATGSTGISSTGEKCAVFGQRKMEAPGTEAVTYPYSGRVYSLKVYKEDTLLADYIPCYRKSDNKPGMYDLVLNKFYYSESGTDFITGPIKIKGDKNNDLLCSEKINQ